MFNQKKIKLKVIQTLLKKEKWIQLWYLILIILCLIVLLLELISLISQRIKTFKNKISRNLLLNYNKKKKKKNILIH